MDTMTARQLYAVYAIVDGELVIVSEPTEDMQAAYRMADRYTRRNGRPYTVHGAGVRHDS